MKIIDIIWERPSLLKNSRPLMWLSTLAQYKIPLLLSMIYDIFAMRWEERRKYEKRCDERVQLIFLRYHYIVMEYCDYDLEKYLKNHDRLCTLTIYKALGFVGNIAKGLLYLHARNILHRFVLLKCFEMKERSKTEKKEQRNFFYFLIFYFLIK